MIQSATLKDFIVELFRDYEANRQIKEPKWIKNWEAYKAIPGLKLDPNIGLGNKESDNPDDNAWRSKTVADITRVKVNAGKILVSDVLLANGEIPMMLKENRCIGDVVGSALEAVQLEAAGIPDNSPASPVSENVLKMTKLIKEQLKRGNAEDTLRKTILSAAVYGEGVSRITAESFSFRVFNPAGASWQSDTVEDYGLKIEPVSVWDFFTDMENHDIQNNAGLFLRTRMSRFDVVQKFRDDPLLVKGSLEHIIRRRSAEDTGADANESPGRRLVGKRKKDLRVLEFWGRVPEYLVQSMENSSQFSSVYSDSDQEEQTEIMAVVVDETIVKFSRVEPRSRPFFRVWWEEGLDDVCGQSIADNMNLAQESLNSFMRCYEDNQKLSGNILLAVKPSMLEPDEGDAKLIPGKVFKLNEAARSASEAIQAIQIPDVGNSSLNAVKMHEERGNNNSMIPEIAYGIQPAGSTTATEVQVRNEKAGKYISDIVRGFDANWIEPVVRFFYEWNMDDDRVPPTFKGQYDIQALGYHSYQDKILRMNRIRDMLTMALSSDALFAKLNLNALLSEWMKANELDPDMFLSNENTANSPFAQEIAQRFDALEQQLASVTQQLPSIAIGSELEAEKQRAEIDKLKAETDKIQGETVNAHSKIQTERAKVIADIQNKNRLAESKRSHEEPAQ